MKLAHSFPCSPALGTLLEVGRVRDLEEPKRPTRGMREFFWE